jgi:hypothetical protein
MSAPTDRVQVLKQESSAGGGDDADRDPFLTYERIDELEDALSATGIFVQKLGGPADELAAIWREGNNLVAKDPAHGTVNLLDASGSGITEAQHKALLQLIHFIDEGPAEGFATGATKTVTGTVFPTQVLWKRADATKLVEQNLTWTGVVPTTIEWKIYAADGTTVLATVTDTVAYSGVFETGRTRAIA